MNITPFLLMYFEYITLIVLLILFWYYYRARTIVKLLIRGYELSYYHDGKRYKIKFPMKRGPNTIIQVLDNTQDVTNKFFEYYGPGRNFHNLVYTPHHLGFDSMTIYYTNGSTKTFEENEMIIV